MCCTSNNDPVNSYSAEEIEYMMKCIITDENDKFNYKSFVDQFHNPAEEIGFNFALLLTNLNEHMSNESRLNKFLEIGSEMLEYFKDWIENVKEHLTFRVKFSI